MPRLFATRLLTRNGSVLKSGVLLFQNLFVETIRVVGIKRFVGVDDEYHICFPHSIGLYHPLKPLHSISRTIS